MRDPETCYRYAMEAHHAMDQVLECLGEACEHDADRFAAKRAMRDAYEIACQAYDEMDGELPFDPGHRGDPEREPAAERPA